MRDGIALAQLTINQKPMTFIVDSAGTTMVNSDRVALPVVRQLRAAPVTISTADAMESWRVVNISSLGLGKKQIHDLNVLSRSLPQLETQMNMEIDGILGADMLMWWDFVALDYGHKLLMLKTSRCTNTGEDLRMMSPDRPGLRRKRG
jgi:Aspartyl protease